MPSSKRYHRCLQRMYALRRFGIKLGLGTIRQILDGMGQPQQRYHAIHIAGSNGKGSVGSGLAAILTASGYKTGLYTSPHLVEFNERILIDHQPISNARVVAAYEAVEAVHAGEREPTFFEFATAMALFDFAQQQVEWAVIETGMGGRLDATNIIDPALCLITNISLEHKMYLGRTITAIAGEKGGIIKPNIPVITGARQASARRVLQRIATQNGAPLYRAGSDYRVRRQRAGEFTYFGIDHRWPGMRSNLIGTHQIENTAMVLAACELLQRRGLKITLETIRQGLRQQTWPGRLEVVQHDPVVILDGAHNLHAARTLGRHLATTYPDRAITLVLGMLDDKPYRQMLKALVPICDRVVFTRPAIDRALPPETLQAAAAGLNRPSKAISGARDAFVYALDTARGDEVICVAGSLYLVGDVKAALAQQDVLASGRAKLRAT
jgi:dihydrofolate synthase/folylpolyglutamate synthase